MIEQLKYIILPALAVLFGIAFITTSLNPDKKGNNPYDDVIHITCNDSVYQVVETTTLIKPYDTLELSIVTGKQSNPKKDSQSR